MEHREDGRAGMRAGWEVKSLGELCEVIAGQSPEGKFYNSDGKGLPFYQGKKDFGDKFIGQPTTWTTVTTKLAHPGDILMSVRAPVGPVNFAAEKSCIGRGLAAIRTKTELDRNFLFYQLIYLQPEIAGKEGAVFASINKSEIAALQLAHAPLAEQQRIVAILDEAFEGIATACKHAEQNLQNAKALFESHLEAVFSQKGEGWVETTIGDVAETFDGPHATPQTVSEGPIFLGISSLQDGKINLRETRHVTQQDFKIWTRRVKPQENDIVFSYETRLGQAAIIPAGLECCLGRRMGLVRPNKQKLDSRFFVYQYVSPVFRSYLETKTIRGATVDRIALRDFPTFPLYLPNLETQTALASIFDTVQAETNRLCDIYTQKVAALDALKKSLLHQAFSGEL